MTLHLNWWKHRARSPGNWTIKHGDISETMTSYQVAEWLRKGIAAAQAGDTQQAYELLLKVVDVDEHNEQAWLWLSSVVESDADREVCLDNVLAINPDNTLAKTGLVHLHTKPAQPPAPPEGAASTPPPQPDPAVTFPAPPAKPGAEETDWWDQPQSIETASVHDTAGAASQSTTPSTVVEQTQVETELAQPQPRRPRRRVQISARRLAIITLLLLGVLAASVAVIAVTRTGVFDPHINEYADVMRPLLAEYDAWWEGTQGRLVEELNRLCGADADGWRNRDVLLSCSSIPSVDCALLAAHCGGDVEEMRERVDELAREAQRTGEALLAHFNRVSPPDDITLSHTRFLVCLQEQVTQAGQVSGLARGEPLSDPVTPPACQMFSSAEAEVRAHVNGG